MLRVILLLAVGVIATYSAEEPRSQAAEPAAFNIRPVTIWSDGTRMAGDLYLPMDLKDGEKRAAILFCAGTGGTKAGNGAQCAKRFVSEGFVVLAFDYRGWGESDCKLMMTAPMPKPDDKGEVTVRARPVRWQMDMADQTLDIRSALSYLAGEPCVDAARIGLFGTSYGGGLVVWVAGNDPRVKCLVAQVPGLGGGRPPGAVQQAYALSTRQARGETEPVPFETGKLGGKMAAYAQMRVNPAKSLGYSPLEAAAKISAPTLILVAEKEDLLNNEENGKKLFDILTTNNVLAEYHVLPDIGHYGVYREAFDVATRMEAAWFRKYLAPATP